MLRIGTRHGATPVASIAVVLALVALGTGSSGSAAPAAPPSNTGEPTISGRAEQGRTLEGTNGRWTGTGPLVFSYAWVRCGTDGGRPDGGDCAIVSGATGRRHTLRAADVGFRMRIRVTATNAEGSQTVASNPTAVVQGPPVNTMQPFPRGSMVVGQVVTADPGTWTGRQPISFAYRWLRCNNAGGECAAIAGGGSRSYRVASADIGRKLRFNVTARNSLGSRTVISTESATVTEPLPSGAIRLPTGEISIPATSVPSTARLIVAQVRFTPRPVRSARNPITVSVRVTDTRGFVVRDAVVFVRTTPRVTSGGDRQATAVDGWLTYQLVPNSNFPQPRSGRNVQVFVKAYRTGDPALAGVAAYRLVQFPLAG
jgi:hypothetical protein